MASPKITAQSVAFNVYTVHSAIRRKDRIMTNPYFILAQEHLSVLKKKFPANRDNFAD